MGEVVKVLIDWDEKFPELFLRYADDEGISPYDRNQVQRYGTEVPDELARKWRDARDAWRAVDLEVQKFIGREP